MKYAGDPEHEKYLWPRSLFLKADRNRVCSVYPVTENHFEKGGGQVTCNKFWSRCRRNKTRPPAYRKNGPFQKRNTCKKSGSGFTEAIQFWFFTWPLRPKLPERKRFRPGCTMFGWSLDKTITASLFQLIVFLCTLCKLSSLGNKTRHIYTSFPSFTRFFFLFFLHTHYSPFIILECTH